MSEDKPQGQRFSLVYLKRGAPQDDSPRARYRIAAHLGDEFYESGIYEFIARELGVPVPGFERFFAKCALKDVLDGVTLAARFLASSGYQYKSQRWVQTANRIFDEENLHYQVDSQGGVHFRYDEEFELNRQATIGILNAPRYANARKQFEDGLAALADVPPDGKRGIRGVFDSAECMFKLIAPNEPRLTAKAAAACLEPLVQAGYKTDATAQRATMKLLRSFEQWIDAAHNYRHEQGAKNPSQPPLELAVWLVSEGACFVRWLASLDSQNLAS